MQKTLLVNDNTTAFDNLKGKLVTQGWRILLERTENKERDLYLVIKRGEETQRLYCKYRRNYYLTYSIEFLEEKGFGESINKQHLQRAIALKADKIVFCYKNTEIKYCYPLQFLNYAESHQTIRKQKGGEITYSVPIKLLQKMF